MADRVDVEIEAPAGGAPEEVRALPARRFRHVRRLLPLGVVALAAAAYGAWRYYSVRETTDDAQIDGHIHSISARVGGVVVQSNMRDDEFVSAGTVLVELDARDYQVALESARADLAEAEAALRASRSDVPITTTTTASQLSTAQAAIREVRASVEGLRNEVEAARSRVATAEARVREAEANYNRAARDVERLKPLAAKEEISRQQFDTAVATADALRAAVDSARAQVREAEQGVRTAESRLEREQARTAQAEAALRSAGTAPEQVAVRRAQAASAAARVEQARAAVAQAELNLERAVIKAPVSGVVSKRGVEEGQMVQPGQQVCAIVSLEDVWVTAQFKETQLRSIRAGEPVEIRVDAYGGRVYRGRVDGISGATGARFSLLPAENASGNFVKVVQRVPVKIVLEQGQDPQHLLRPGMSVVATVLTR